MMDKQMENLLFEVADSASGVVVGVEYLGAIRTAVNRLMESIDETIDNNWHEDRVVACLTIAEIEQRVRLIYLAFDPLFEKMSESVITLDRNIEQLRKATRK